MPSAFDDEWAGANLDLSAEFAEPVRLIELARDIVAIVDIPERKQSMSRIQTELPDPSITAQSYLVAGLNEGHTLSFRGQTYAVAATMADGTGWTKVTLAPAQTGFVNTFE